jgi:hypothetical protein
MTSAGERVPELVCRLPAPKRSRGPLVVLEAYFDDSQQDASPRLLVFAGYVAPVERWAAFVTEWQACLDEAPSIPRFKMSEAMGFNGPFRRWAAERRDARVASFYRIIAAHVSGGAWSVLPLDDFAAVVQSDPAVPRRMKNRFFYSFFGIAHNLGRFLHLLDLHEPVTFVFDEQSRGKKQILEAWDSFEAFSPVPACRLGGSPRFEDDEKFLPLQAADFCAWVMRRKAVLRAQRRETVVFPWERAAPRYKLLGKVWDAQHLKEHVERAKAGSRGG